MKARTGEAGFTLLELIVVIVVGGVLTAMASPRIRDLMAKQRVARAATALQNSLESAYAIASRNRRPIRIAWNASSMQMQVTDRAGTTVYRRVTIGADSYGLRSGDVTFSRSPIEIYPNGLANDTLLISVRSTNASRRVRMTRAGMVRVE